MNIKERKLNLIQSLLTLEDEKSISFLEAYFQFSLEEMSLQELINRAKKSMEEISAGKITSQEDLEAESKLW